MTPSDPRESDPDYIDPAILKERAAVRDMAEIIWTISRADEGTISAMGADIIAQALADAGFGHVASVERERDRWKAAWEMADPLLTEHDRLAAQVAQVQALLDAYMSWDGDPDSEYSSSPKQREQLYRALNGPVDKE